MEIGLSIAALVISILSGAFSLYTFLWTAKRDRKQATLEAYNRLQAEVFDHVLATLHTFGLKAFQSPTGLDFHEEN